MSNLSSWVITKPHIDLTLLQQEKTQPTTSSAKNRFKELRDKYSDHTAFYTDWSKTIDRTGAEVTNINNYKQIRLPNIASIYSAELQAIIFSYSLYSLVANQEGNQNDPYIQEILETYHYLTNFGKTVILAWFPSHLGIKSNQIADTLVNFHSQHHVVLVARISLTLSRHFSLSFIALGRSSGQHPVSSHSYWMYVRAGRPTFARPCVGVHKSTSLMSSSRLLQQCPACLVHLTWIVFVIGGRWPYSWCLVGCCHQDLFKIAHSILV